jgi:hypothetical protein
MVESNEAFIFEALNSYWAEINLDHDKTIRDSVLSTSSALIAEFFNFECTGKDVDENLKLTYHPANVANGVDRPAIKLDLFSIISEEIEINKEMIEDNFGDVEGHKSRIYGIRRKLQDLISLIDE